MNQPDRICANCDYYLPPDPSNDPPLGVCRRYPPQIVVLTRRGSTVIGGGNSNSLPVETTINSLFPYIGEDHSCGEWKEKS